MAGDGVEALYRNYGVLADAGDKAGEQTEAFLGLLESAKGSAAVKRLVSGFIAKFARFFPTLEGDIMNVLFDLVEDDESLVRQAAIKSLPELCKNNKSNKDLCTKVADVLTQLLVSDDPADVILVKSAMSTILIHDTPSALIGIFDQILGEDETLREKAIEYVSVPLMDMRHVLFIPKEENEKCLLELVKKVLGDVTAAEFETFVDVLGKLHHLQSPAGANVIIDVIAEQAELDGNFQSEGPEAIDRFITCFRLALKYCKKGGSSYQFVRYASVEILPSFASITDSQKQQNTLQLLAEGSCYVQPENDIELCLESLHVFLLLELPSYINLYDDISSPEDHTHTTQIQEHVPSPPEETATESPKLQFSVVECLLFAFHQLLNKSPGFLASPENDERLKELRKRLQYFARGSQTYHNQLQVALKGKTQLELKEEQNKLRQMAIKMTSNISTLIKDFFRNPPTYNATVQLSWGAKKVDLGTKRSLAAPIPSSNPSKRKLSPIRFDEDKSSGGASGGVAKQRGGRREARAIYNPPRRQPVTNGNSFDESSWKTGGGGGGGGRGGGRRGGWRSGRGFRRGRGTWRNY